MSRENGDFKKELYSSKENIRFYFESYSNYNF